MALAEALRQQDKLDEANAVARTAIQAAPDADETHFALAQVLGRQGKLREADAAVVEALRLDPNYAPYYGYRTQILFLRGRYPAALGCAQDGLRLDPEQVECLLWRALTQEQQEHPSAADHDFQRLLRVAPESALVHTQLGSVLLNRHEPAAAAQHLTEALRQDPESAPQLVPLLGQARRQATKPHWLLRDIQREDQAREIGLEPGLKSVLVRAMNGAYTLRARWLTRHDPLFQLSRAQIWQRRLNLWYSVILLLPVLVFQGSYFGWVDLEAPLSSAQIVGLLVGMSLFGLVAHLLDKRTKG